MNNKNIYFDNNSTTKPDDRVIEAMLPYFREYYSNASSNHNFGNKVRNEVEAARRRVADLIGADNKEIIFTSGATEAINFGLRSLALSSFGNRKKIVTVATEHKAVIETCNYLEGLGFEVIILPVNRGGLVDLDIVKNTIDNNTLLVTVMHTNNETGVIQPIEEIANISRNKGAIFFCDTTQAIGKIQLNVESIGADMLCVSAHKFYGPKGVGAIYINNKLRKKINFSPILFGGGHEDGLRSGTLNVPGIIGLGKAAELAEDEIIENAKQIKKLKDILESQLLDINGAFINGNKENRIYNTTNICFPGIDSSILIGLLDYISVSNGSACNSRIVEPSHVLLAMGLNSEEVSASVRFSLSKYNTLDDVQTCVAEVKAKIKRLE
jgi:cysteine desulfurase